MAKEKTYDVFISYRRQGGAEKAELTKGELSKRGFRETRMFMDTRSLSSGNYMEGILKAIDASRNLVVIVTKDSFRNLSEESPSVKEISHALKVGKCRAIGVSNFYPDHFIDFAANNEIVPMVNQIETHVFQQQVESRRYMDELGIAHMSWGPLAEGKNGFFTNETLISIGAKYGKTGPQVALRYLIERGVIIIPKSSRKERMAENLNIFDFSLSAEDMDALLKLDTGAPVVMPSHHNPEIVKWFMSMLPKK